MYVHCWYSSCAQSLCDFPLNSTEALLSPSSFTFPIITSFPFTSTEESSLPQCSQWGTSQQPGSSFNLKKHRFWPWPYFKDRMSEKRATKKLFSPKDEDVEQLIMRPEDVLEVWRRDVKLCQFPCFLPPSLLLRLAAFRACSKRFWVSGLYSHLSRLKLNGDSARSKEDLCHT